MTNENIKAVTEFGLRLIEAEFADFSENGCDDIEYISAIKRISLTAYEFIGDGSTSKMMCKSVKKQLIDRARDLFTQEWMNPLDDDEEPPNPDEAIEKFNSMLHRNQH